METSYLKKSRSKSVIVPRLRGYDPVYGARPLKRLLQKEVETGLSRQMLAGDISDGDNVIADYLDGKLVFEKS